MYTLLTYRDGKRHQTIPQDSLSRALNTGSVCLDLCGADEFEVTNKTGRVVAYARGQDSPEQKTQDLFDAIDKKESV